MKSFPRFEAQNTVSSIKNPDIDFLSHEQLEDLDKDVEKKLSKQVQQINSNVDKEFASINTIYAGAIDNALMQISDYFTSVQHEDKDKYMGQYTIQKPHQNSSQSAKSPKEINFFINIARNNQNTTEKIKLEKKRIEDLKRELHI